MEVAKQIGACFKDKDIFFYIHSQASIKALGSFTINSKLVLVCHPCLQKMIKPGWQSLTWVLDDVRSSRFLSIQNAFVSLLPLGNYFSVAQDEILFKEKGNVQVKSNRISDIPLFARTTRGETMTPSRRCCKSCKDEEDTITHHLCHCSAFSEVRFR